ncbi:MAG TPA: hypothetical protein VGD67_16865 [Pseudonocardiaceae bacterium]
MDTERRDDPAVRTGRTGSGVHWLAAGALLGGASWLLIGAVVAAALGSWTVAGLLVAGAAGLAGFLVRLARRGHRAGGRPEPAAAADEFPERADRTARARSRGGRVA